MLSNLAQSCFVKSPLSLQPSHPSAYKENSGLKFLLISGKTIALTQVHHKIKLISIWLPQPHLLSQVPSLAWLMGRLCFGEESQVSVLVTHISVPKASYMCR